MLQRMSHSESSSSSFGLEDPQWLCMVTLFVASLVTLALYFIQYFHPGLIGSRQRAAAEDSAAAEEEQEAAALLGWALSKQSWKSQWRGAWCRALNEEATKRGVSPVTADQPAVGQVTPIKNVKDRDTLYGWVAQGAQITPHSFWSCF